MSDAWTNYTVGTIESAFPLYQPNIFAVNLQGERVNVFVDTSGNVKINPAGSTIGRNETIQTMVVFVTK